MILDEEELILTREEALLQLNAAFDLEKKGRAREAWFHGVLWVLLKLSDDDAEKIKNELLIIRPDKKRQVDSLLNC
jgi:hypothetical protein